MTKLIRQTLILITISVLFSCEEKIEDKHSLLDNPKIKIDKPNIRIDSSRNESLSVDRVKTNVKLTSDRKLEQFHYPNMSRCGGDLTGFYDSDELVKITSRYGAEFGYSRINVEFDNAEIRTISYHEHFADYEMYSQTYPKAKFIEEDKLTFTDTSYLINFGNTTTFKKYAGKKLVSTEMNESKFQQLINCISTMRNELDSER